MSERDYRRAYWQGYSDAIDTAKELKAPTNVVRQLSLHFDGPLTAWRYGDVSVEVTPPQFFAPTYEVQRVRALDGTELFKFLHKCPSCGERHIHSAEMAGHRVAHCHKGDMHPRGYYIVEVPK